MAAKMGGPRRNASGAQVVVDVLAGFPAGKIEASIFPKILKGIHDRAGLEIRERPELERIRISVRCQDPGDFHPATGRLHAFRHVRSGDRHGTILVFPFEEAAVELVSQRIMTVSVLENYSLPGIDAVDTDEEAAASSLVGCLHAAGHTRIGFLSRDDPAGGHSAERRYRGYARGLGARGLRLNRHWVLNARMGDPRLSPPGVTAAASRTRESGVTAWVCAGDDEAYHLMQDLRAAGIRVPQDCSITGFGGLGPPAGLPRVTSMRAPYELIGSSALTRMINRVMYPSSPQRKISVEAQLVAGETIAAPSQP